MLPIALIAFREVLEVSIILSIVLGATKELKNRNNYVILGLLIGVVLAFIIASFLNYITGSFSGYGQEIYNISVLSLASITIISTLIWMRKNSFKMINDIKENTRNVSEGNGPLYMLSLIIATSIIREGVELVLFIKGAVVYSDISKLEVIIAACLGGFAALAIAFMAYLGITNIPKKFFFKATTIMLIMLAAGMISQIPNYLSSIGLLDYLTFTIWDSSKLLSEHSFLGNLLHLTIGYSDKPSAMQLIFYMLTVLVSYAFIKRTEVR